MPSCARIALVTLIVSAGGLAGCGSTDEMSETFNGWLSGRKSPIERQQAVPDDTPSVTESVSPDYRQARKTQQRETSKPLRKKVKEVRAPEKPQTEEAPSSPPRRARPAGQAVRQTGEPPPSKPSPAAAPAAQPKTEQPKAEPPKPDPQKPAQTKPPQPDASEPQSASSKPPQLRLKTLWPDAPASGTFSR